MSKKRDRTKQILAAESRIPAWVTRYTNTLIIILMWPCIFVGFLYLAVFFILNSSYGPKILHSQLSGFLRGDYYAATMKTDGFLQYLTMTDVCLAEAGQDVCHDPARHEEAVIFARRVKAKIPIAELVDLFDDPMTLTIGTITAEEANVNLDFTRGELNILKVVLPYASKPEPPEPIDPNAEPSSPFVVNLSDLNVAKSKVHLIFDGFRIDLYGTEVDNFTLRTGEKLEMISRLSSSPDSKTHIEGVRVEHGELVFNPAMFSFSLSSVGDADEGLVMSGGPGTAGKIGYAYQEMARHLSGIVDGRTDLHYGEEDNALNSVYRDYHRQLCQEQRLQNQRDNKNRECPPETRGKFVIPLSRTYVDGFNWSGDEFVIPRVTSEIGNGGTMILTNGMMNVGPKDEDVAAHSEKYHHKPSGLPAEESVLWAGNLKLGLPVSDPILSYFFGPILEGDEPLELRADMAGDLARVSGDIELDMPQFATFNVDVEHAALRAKMDGQHLMLNAFEANTSIGGLLAAGYYDIMDGNFDIDLWAGQEPEDERKNYVTSEFGERLADGVTPMDLLPDGELQHFSGLLNAHLRATSKDGDMKVLLPDPVVYRFDNPYAGISSFTIHSIDGESEEILGYRNGIVTSPGGLIVDVGSDHVRVEPGLRLNTNNLSDSFGGVTAHINNPAVYAEQFGLEGLKSGPIDVMASYTPCGSESCGGLKLKTSDKISYMGVDVNDIDIVLSLNKSSLRSQAFLIDTSLGRITANLEATVSPKTILDPYELPFHAEFFLKKVDLKKLDALGIESLNKLGLAGNGEGRLYVDGPIDDLKARLMYSMTDVSALGVDASRILLVARYEDKKVLVPALNLWFGPSELSKEEAARLEEEEAAERARQAEEISRQLKTEKLTAEEAEKLFASIQPQRPNRRRVRRRTPDFSLGAMTYDLEENTVELNVVLQTLNPNDFQVFRDLDIPVTGQIAFDISARADLDMLMSTSKAKMNNPDAIKSTWVEGNIDLSDIHYGDLYFGDQHILMSRSAQFALVKGTFLEMDVEKETPIRGEDGNTESSIKQKEHIVPLELSGFVRTSPRFSASMSLNFPNLDVLTALRGVGIDLSSLIQQFKIKDAVLAGSLGFCMKDADNMSATLLLDDISADVLGERLELTQSSFSRVNLSNLPKISGRLGQLEFKFRDSFLKLSGALEESGRASIDLNGEIDAALAHSIPSLSDTVRESSGLFGISLSASANVLNGKFNMKDVEIGGYLGVRNPISVLTELSKSPFELSKGFIVIDKKSTRCKKNELCLYTPEEQPFVFGINDQEVSLDIVASSKGNVAASLNGDINAAVASLFVKDISAAEGALSLNVNVAGNFLNKSGSFDFDPYKFQFDASLGIKKDENGNSIHPISIEMRTLNEPITVDQGMLRITKGEGCSNGGECIVIPKKEAFKGSLMGGTYHIFGEVQREAFVPKNGKLSITANNVSFRMKDELSLTVSPDIQITAEEFTDFGKIKVSGDIDVADARYKKNFDDGSSNFIKDQILSMFIDSKKRVDTFSPSFLRRWPSIGKINLDIGVMAENSVNVDVKIATAVIDLDLGTQLRIGGTVKDFAPTGIFQINQGVFSFRDNDFEFQNGSQVAFNGSMDGKIDITATTEISTKSNAFSAVTGNTDLDRRKRISSGSDSSSGDLYSITLTVGGSVYKPVWSFESSPYLTDTNVYALILTGKTIEDFSGDDVAMESLLSPLFTSQLDTFIDADDFKFVFSNGSAQFVYVKQITDAFRVAGGVSIRGAYGNEQALSAEYYFYHPAMWYIDVTGQNTADEEGRAPTFKIGGHLHWHWALGY